MQHWCRMHWPTNQPVPDWCRRYEMRDVLAIESEWLTELAPHMYHTVPANR